MDIDLTILRTLEREKEISFDVLVEAIEQALLTAYHKTPGAVEQARVELDRKSGHVTVFAAELDDEGAKIGEFDDTPEGFGRIAATTAKQIMLQRLRDAEDDLRFGEFSGKEGDLISGVIQQGPQPRRRDGRPRQARGPAPAHPQRTSPPRVDRDPPLPALGRRRGLRPVRQPHRWRRQGGPGLHPLTTGLRSR